jgi:hypothetical protein
MAPPFFIDSRIMLQAFCTTSKACLNLFLTQHDLSFFDAKVTHMMWFGFEASKKIILYVHLLFVMSTDVRYAIRNI